MSSYNLINKEHSCNSKDIQTHKYPLSRAELQFAAKNVLKKVLEL